MRRFREALGIKQEALAMDMNVSQQTIPRLESKKSLGEEMILKVAKCLNVAPQLIEELEEDPATIIIENNTFEDGSSNNTAANDIDNTDSYNDVDCYNENTNSYNDKTIHHPLDEIIRLNDQVARLSDEKVALYERLLAAEKEKVAFLEQFMKEKKEE